MRPVGLHIRLNGTLEAAAERAERLQLTFFQCFLVLKSTGDVIRPTPEDVAAFLEIRRRSFKELYVHGSYWINLAGVANTHHKALQRELIAAKKLEFTHMILHPGSAKGGICKEDGIDAVARALNVALKTEHEIRIILENSAHGALSVGGDINDFALLLQKLDHPEKVQFCIDTAHAYAYGYDLVDAHCREQFIELLQSTIGVASIAMIHVNDTKESLGSKMDKHDVLGSGNLKEDTLRAFCVHPQLQNVPLLLELPVMPDEEEEAILNIVRTWHN